MKIGIMVLIAIVAMAGATLLTVPGCKSQPQNPTTVVNTHCPIMGTKIDPNSVPDYLTREFKGQKVGFCCPSCLPSWDKLTDAEKETKLKTRM